MKKLSTLFFFLLLLAGTICAQDDAAIDRAKTLSAKGDHKAALSVLNKAVAASPLNAELFFRRAEVHMDLKNYMEALTDYTEAIKLDGTKPWYRVHRGILYANAGMYNEGLADYDVALNLATADSVKKSIYVNRSAVYSMTRQFDQAHSDLMQAYRIDSLDIAVVNNLGTVLDELGQQDQAIVFLKKVIEIDPNFVGGYANLAFQFGKLGRHQEALEYSNQAIALAPNEGILYNNRGYVYYNLGDYKTALKDINRSLELYPANSYAYRNRALVYIAQGKKSKACEDLQKAIELGFTTNYGNECADLLRTHCP